MATITCIHINYFSSYYLKYIILPPTQLTAAALVITYWPRVSADKVNPGVWITIFMVAIIIINYFGVKVFGELEFWLSAFKIIVILGIILCSFIFALGGGPDHDRRGFRYWKSPGAFNHKYVEGDLGKFLAFWSTMVQATFAFLGKEISRKASGEQPLTAGKQVLSSSVSPSARPRIPARQFPKPSSSPSGALSFSTSSVYSSLVCWFLTIPQIWPSPPKPRAPLPHHHLWLP